MPFHQHNPIKHFWELDYFLLHRHGRLAHQAIIIHKGTRELLFWEGWAAMMRDTNIITRGTLSLYCQISDLLWNQIPFFVFLVRQHCRWLVSGNVFFYFDILSMAQAWKSTHGGQFASRMSNYASRSSLWFWHGPPQDPKETFSSSIILSHLLVKYKCVLEDEKVEQIRLLMNCNCSLSLRTCCLSHHPSEGCLWYS